MGRPLPSGTAMISREQRTPFSEWWWTVDRPLLAAIIALMLGGIILRCGESAGRDQDRARPVSLLQPPCVVSVAGLHRADRVSSSRRGKSPHRDDRACALSRADRGGRCCSPRGQGLAALDHPDRSTSRLPNPPSGLRGDCGVAVCGIGAAAGNAATLDRAGAVDDAGVAVGAGT